ncbi:unnamed protein product [Brassicogethes aeneus]|uniref:DOMON domain-containing protein n=1 Tax=Brassicogethes aeneus TaxID=1431903 RepID=A0A9P0AQP2_BRAAE|nr:unnamed protein product [Brassicogethes aeneus]
MFRWFITLLILCRYTIFTAGNNGVFKVSLNGENNILMNWALDYNSETVIFEIHIPSDYGWFALGFSDRGELFPADYCLLSQDLNGKFKLHDTWANKDGVLHIDDKQDCVGFHIKKTKEIIKYTFKRKLDTCDLKDYIIEDGTTHVVWSRGKRPLYRVDGLNVSSEKSGDTGMVRVHLLKNPEVNANLPEHVKPLNILADKVKVPNEETTYWCRVIKLPDEYKKKHHIYQYESNIEESSQGLVHHMEVFHCETDAKRDIPLYSGNCFGEDRPPETQVCKRVLAAWAMGAPPFIYPKEASLPIGGEKFNQYLMLEIHYNNPELIKGKIDSSGITMYTSAILKDIDAGVIELGLEYTDKMAIPPGQESFPLFGYCTSACTAMSLPSTGITIFGSQLHTHLTGVKVLTRHFDAYGNELPELNRDNHYSTHYQEIRRLKRPVKVLPGHALITRCDYSTKHKTNVTLGGFQITDEMCVNYVHYYPHTDLEVCKSSISDQALATFFRYMNEWENQETSPTKGVSENYKAIEWNKMRVELLREVYGESPLSMQCNMSSGDRFPGYWENAFIPPIITPLAPPARQCDHLE